MGSKEESKECDLDTTCAQIHTSRLIQEDSEASVCQFIVGINYKATLLPHQQEAAQETVRSVFGKC